MSRSSHDTDGLRSRAGLPVQGPPLQCGSAFTKDRGGCSCSPKVTGCAYPQLPQRLAHSSSLTGPVVYAQGIVLRQLDHVGHRVNWNKSTLPISSPTRAQLSEKFQTGTSGPSEILFKAFGAHGILSSGYLTQPMYFLIRPHSAENGFVLLTLQFLCWWTCDLPSVDWSTIVFPLGVSHIMFPCSSPLLLRPCTYLHASTQRQSDRQKRNISVTTVNSFH